MTKTTANNQALLIKLMIGLVIGLNLLTAAWLPIHGDIVFHTDIARDFLLLEDLVTTKKLTLIGPRAGGIPGVFYGPLWLYLNLPVYSLSGGNPAVQGFFWVGLFILGSGLFYWVARKLLSRPQAVVTTLMFMAIEAPLIPNSLPHLGSILLSPLWFYLFYRFLQQTRLRDLIGTYFILGVIAHFQVAFAGPMIVLVSLYLIPYLRKRNKLPYLLAALVLVIPGSTFILFEARHQFLQTKAILAFLTPPATAEAFNLGHNLVKRVQGLIFDGWGILPSNLDFLVALIGGLVWWQKRRHRKSLEFNGFDLFLYFYLGFWLICIFFRGEVWSYYYRPFFPLTLLALGQAVKVFPKILQISLVALVLGINLGLNLQGMIGINSFTGQSDLSWQFYNRLAQKIYQTAPDSFGYFVYTPDQYGYQGHYAMIYNQKQTSIKLAVAYRKLKTTYLIIAPDLKNNPYTSAGYWRTKQVKISGLPNHKVTYPNGQTVESYNLNQTDLDSGTDPNLIHDLYFR